MICNIFFANCSKVSLFGANFQLYSSGTTGKCSMADWAGFSEAELERIKHASEATTEKSRSKIVKPVLSKRTLQGIPGKLKQPGQNRRNATGKRSASQSNIPTGALLSKPAEVISEGVGESIPATDQATVQQSAGSYQEEKEIVIDDETIREKEKIRLEDVHQRQKQMEEKNRRKKEMLSKEIAERKKRAFAESHKLMKIQEELAKLDQLLNVDVSILRDKIDEACMEFSHAQKRFEKAETEYISAKMELHMRTSRKEDLTEHLYHLIQANEERKAKKLEELMHKLEVEEAYLEEKQTERDAGDKEQIVHQQAVPETKTDFRETDLKTSPPTQSNCETQSNAIGTTVAEPDSDSLHGANATK